ncbi:MAG TPA: FtsX-like permease family protein [Lacipirellulaceae bacterium]|nr:FtsX-like permease family protein [Lacipirellulaceae bacterium]
MPLIWWRAIWNGDSTMMVNWKFAWREVRQRPGRAILTLLSIVIGVAAVVGVTIAAGTTGHAFDEIFKAVAGKAQLEIVAPLGSSFDQKIVAKVRALPEVQAVAPLIKRPTVMYVGKDKKNQKEYRGIVALGIDPEFDGEVRDYDITAGQNFSKNVGGIMLDETFAKDAGIKVGDQVELLTRRAFVKTTVLALYKPRGVRAAVEGMTLLMPLEAAQYYFYAFKKADSAQIVLKPDADEAAARNEIKKLLPEGITVRKPEARSPLAEETSLSTQIGMGMARAFSLIVAVFIIANTFLINVTQRRKQLGILRAIGATQRQIADMVLREALVMGIVGTVLGIGLGILTAQHLTKAMAALYQTKLPPIDFHQAPFLLGTWHEIPSPQGGVWSLLKSIAIALGLIVRDPFVLGTVCGLAVSLLAAALPAYKASHLSPLEAMRDVLHEELEGASRWLVRLGACVTVLGLGMIAATIQGWLPMLFCLWSSLALLIGVVLMLPLVLRPFSAMAASIFNRVIPVEGKLARLQLLRNHSRSTLTIGVVFIAISTGISLANSIMDTVENVRTWYQRAYVADFWIRAEGPSMGTGTAANVPDAIESDIKRVDGVETVDGLRFASGIEVNGEEATIIARDHTKNEPPDLDVITGDLSKLREQFAHGEVAIGSVLAERTHLKVGDKVKLSSQSGPKTFPIAAIVNDYQSGGLTIHMERKIAHDELSLEGINAFIITADHKRLGQVRAELDAIAKKNGLRVLSATDIQESIDQRISGVVAALWAMVVVLLVVSAVGVTNTLTMNVLEQTREIGLLRIVAMTRNQVKKTIFTQAMLMAALALAPGIAAGVGVAYLINLAMMPVLGHPVSFTVHPLLMICSFIAGLIIVSLAAWLPANRASRLDLPTALRTL